jgi:ABC-type proline/glycine betaine transport system substrate-binding protein
MAWHSPIVRAAAQALSLALFAAVAPAGAATVPESQDPIVIGKLDWTGQEITAEIAGEILRRMGYKVQFVQTTQVPLFQAVADGQITAYLENWNQNSKKYYDEFTKDGRIEPLGPTGLKGQEGWYYPDYVAEKCPGLPDWRALKKCAEIFCNPRHRTEGAAARLSGGMDAGLERLDQGVESRSRDSAIGRRGLNGGRGQVGGGAQGADPAAVVGADLARQHLQSEAGDAR